MTTEPDFDIYDDLDDALMVPLDKDVERVKAAAEASEAERAELKEKLARKDEEIERLTESNYQLQKNLSILVLTSKSELSR